MRIHESDVHSRENTINLLHDVMSPSKTSGKYVDRKEPSLLKVTKCSLVIMRSDICCITVRFAIKEPGKDGSRHRKTDSLLCEIRIT